MNRFRALFVSSLLLLALPATGSAEKDALVEEKLAKLEAMVSAMKQIEIDKAQILKAKTLECKPAKGAQFTPDGGEFKLTNNPWSKSSKDHLVIYDINLESRTAKMAGNQGTGSTLRILPTETGLTFLETPGAVVNMSTIFFHSTGKKDEFYFVTSRKTYRTPT